MPGESSVVGPMPAVTPNDVLDEIDRRIVRALADDARMPNNALEIGRAHV